jgi:S-adenosylmethionine uptake transporter
MAATAFRHSPLAPIVATIAGIALFSGMDAAIKHASLEVGVYTALLLRNAIGFAMILPLWCAGPHVLPSRRVLALHFLRSGVNCGMALLFFVGIVRLPMAEGIALSFVAPLVALFLAALVLGETIRRAAIVASLLGVAGVVVIVADRLGTGHVDRDVVIGLAAILGSALLYAINLVLQRKLALLAGAVEVATFQNLIVAVILALFAPWIAVIPTWPVLGATAAGALLGTTALGLLSWAYARAEAQVLVPIEYTAFLWAALLGWLIFAEPVGPATLAGAALIVLGCWIGTRDPARERTEQTAV